MWKIIWLWTNAKIVINNVNHNERIYSITKWPHLCRRLSFSSVFYWLRLLLKINYLDIPRTLRNEVITTVQSVCTAEISDCFTSLHDKAENFPGCLSIIYQMRFSQKIFYWKFQLNLPTNRPETPKRAIVKGLYDLWDVLRWPTCS